MLYRSLNVASILLLSWFVFISMQSSQQMNFKLSDLRQSLLEKIELSASAQLETNKQIGEIEGYISNQKLLSQQIKQVNAKLLSQQKLTSLHRTHSKVLNAELLRLNKQHEKAASLLKSTKKDIWKAGDTYQDKQKVLRGLMPKIDALVKAWSNGDTSATASSVYSVLNKIIQEKGN